VADNLELALMSTQSDSGDITDSDAAYKTLVEGVEMTNNNLIKTFKQHDIVGYGAIGMYIRCNMIYN